MRTLNLAQLFFSYEDLREGQVEGARDLHGALGTRDGLDGTPDRLNEAGIVGGGGCLIRTQGGARLVRAHEDVPTEALRGLHGHHVGATGRARDHAGRVHGLEGVGDGQDGNDGTRAGGNRVDNALGDLRGRQGSRRVVDEDDRVRLALAEGSQAQGHRLLARTIGAGDDGEVVDIGQGALKIFDRRGRGRHDDRPHSPGT